MLFPMLFQAIPSSPKVLLELSLPRALPEPCRPALASAVLGRRQVMKKKKG
jgi:hypothetical protein